ncbi:MAG TPA: MGMT family protein [Anaerolineales bacterium]|nr:MGMT family protein [Anaerolineales bacterium]
MSPGFTSPPDPHLFRLHVWEMVRKIPVGKVATYGQIAALVPIPAGLSPKDYKAFGPRWVGGAMAACPPDVPWQRVINAQGKISLKRGSGESEQRALLEAEGVVFDERQKVDLKRFGWEGPVE